MTNLQENLNAIKKMNPELHTWLKKEPDVDWLEEIKSKNGDPNLLINRGGRPHLAYSMTNPTKEANKAVKMMGLHKDSLSITIGMGLGYLIKVVLSKMKEGHRMVVIEPIAHMIKTALKHNDFSKEIQNGTLLIVAPGKEEVAFALHFLNQQFVISDWIMTIDKYTNYRPEEYAELTRFAADILNQILCNTGTVAGAAGAKIADNGMQCLPYVLRHRGVSELKNLYKGKPAILVSTGPSLAKNIHHLIGLQDKVIIIAVGQALRVLLAYDITPDFIATVDFGEVNYVHFKGLMDCKIPLVTIDRTYAKLIRDWQGPKFVAATPVPSFEKMATGILTDKGFIEAGGSVAHLVFGIAKQLGCNPIIFIGQDLSLGETSHSLLADAGGKISVNQNTGEINWEVTDQRCHLHNEKKETYSMGQAAFCDGYYGKPILTNMGLDSFRLVFEGMIEQYCK